MHYRKWNNHSLHLTNYITFVLLDISGETIPEMQTLGLGVWIRSLLTDFLLPLVWGIDNPA